MARYKRYSRKQTRLIPVSFKDQIIPGTFEYALDDLIDHEVDLTVFESRFENDDTGAPAYDPAVLMKIVPLRILSWGDSQPQDRQALRG